MPMNMEMVFRKDVLRAYLEANRRAQAIQTDQRQILPVAVLNTFLGVAVWAEERANSGGDPLRLEELADLLDIAPTTLSTHLRYLGEHYRDQRDGLDLISTEVYPLNRRQKVVRLTRKGRALAAQLSYILQGITGNDNTQKGT